MAEKKPVKTAKTKKHLAREHREARQTRIILIVAIAVGVIILGLVLYGIIDRTVIRPRTPVAQVGDDVVTVREFETFVQYTRVQMLNQSFQYYTLHQQFSEFGGNFLQTAQSIATQLTQPISLGREVLDEMIDNLIIQQEAEKRGITVSEAEVDAAVQAAFGFFPDGTPTPTTTATLLPTATLSDSQLALINTPTPLVEEVEEPEAEQTPKEEGLALPTDDGVEETDEVIDEGEVDEPEPGAEEPELAITPEVTPTITLTPTPYTTEMFARNIRDFNDLYAIYNINIDNLREILGNQLLREKLVDEMTQDLSPLRDEIRARHILVETYEEALDVIALLEEGADFYTLAAEYSTDESNRERGGDLGWFNETMMVPEFSDAAFALDESEISDPVETTFGFHIIQVMAKRTAQIPPAEFTQIRQSNFSQWLSEQRTSRSDITIFEGWDTFVPTTPEVPPQFLAELYQQ